MTLLPEPREQALRPGAVRYSEPAVHSGADLPAQGYALTIGDSEIRLDAADAAGEFYGRMTLRQLARLHPDGLPTGTIRDWPDLPERGEIGRASCRERV